MSYKNFRDNIIATLQEKILKRLETETQTITSRTFNESAKLPKPRVDLGGFEKSFTDFLNKHYQKLISLAGDIDKLIAYVKEESKDYYVSSEYLRKFESNVRSQKNLLGVQKYITNIVLKGSGLSLEDK